MALVASSSAGEMWPAIRVPRICGLGKKKFFFGRNCTVLLHLYHSRTLSTVGSLLRSGITAFGVKNTSRNGSQKEQGQCSAKSSIKRRLRGVSVNQRRTEVAKSAVSIYVSKEPVLSCIIQIATINTE